MEITNSLYENEFTHLLCYSKGRPKAVGDSEQSAERDSWTWERQGKREEVESG